MTLLESDGKEIASASWIVNGTVETIIPKEGEFFRVSVEHTGDGPYEGQALIWLVIEKDGIENRRFNAVYVESISWK
jgi:hypothetical protein